MVSIAIKQFRVRTRVAASWMFRSNLPFVACSKNAFPPFPARPQVRDRMALCAGSHQPVRTSLHFTGECSSVNRAFVRFAIRGCVAFKACRAPHDRLFPEPFTRRFSTCENAGFDPSPDGNTNLEPRVYPEPNRSRAIIQEVFSRHMPLKRATFRPVTARITPPRSAFGGCRRVNPAPAINSATAAC